MKIVIMGGSGLIGSKLGKKLQALGHEVVAASRSSGVDATTGKGLAEALKNAQVVIDVTNSPSFEEQAAIEFFKNSCGHLSATEKETRVKHHVALSIVGTDRMANSGYFHAKNTQETLIKASGIPYTIVQSTQFFEFLKSIADSASNGQTVRLPPVSFQPIAADDVVSILADIAVTSPLKSTIEIAGPECAAFPDLIQKYLKATNDPRKVIADPKARYFGMEVTEDSLVPQKNPRLGPTTLESWLKNQGSKAKDV